MSQKSARPTKSLVQPANKEGVNRQYPTFSLYDSACKPVVGQYHKFLKSSVKVGMIVFNVKLPSDKAVHLEEYKMFQEVNRETKQEKVFEEQFNESVGSNTPKIGPSWRVDVIYKNVIQFKGPWKVTIFSSCISI